MTDSSLLVEASPKPQNLNRAKRKDLEMILCEYLTEYISVGYGFPPLVAVYSKPFGREDTEEYIDLTARRENLQRQEKRLLEILALGNTVDDVLKVEKELERVRGEIDRLTGKTKYLENQVALSTITATFTQPVETPLPEIDWTEPLKTGVAFLYSAVRGLVIFAFAATPFAAIGVPSYLVLRHRRKRRTQRETATQGSEKATIQSITG